MVKRKARPDYERVNEEVSQLRLLWDRRRSSVSEVSQEVSEPQWWGGGHLTRFSVSSSTPTCLYRRVIVVGLEKV